MTPILFENATVLDTAAGEMCERFLADLLVIDGDPLRDTGVLQDPERRLMLIMKGGTVHKDLLS